MEEKEIVNEVKEKKAFTKKQKILISVAIVVLIAIIATAICVPLLVLNKGEFLPEVKDFDVDNDAYVKISWNEVKKAKNYIIEYYYDKIDEDKSNVVSVQTSAEFYFIKRQKGVLAFRAKAIMNNKESEFCSWQYYNVPPLVLEQTSNVQLNNEGTLSWTTVKYLDVNTLKEVPSYYIDFSLSGALIGDNDINSYNNYSITNSFNISQYVSSYIIFDDGEQWEDVTLTVRIKANNKTRYYPSDIKSYEYLYNAYDENEYYESILIIDEQKFRDIKG